MGDLSLGLGEAEDFRFFGSFSSDDEDPEEDLEEELEPDELLELEEVDRVGEARL